jgi:diamine N-acetyltransferase
MNINVQTLDQQAIDRLEPLWLKLIEHHQERSQHFKEHYAGVRFENRKKELLEKARPHPLHIDMALQADTPVGYCISSVDSQGVGEIDSILVEKACRGAGLGQVLMGRACRWMDSLAAKRKIIAVGEGNEEVFGFYRRFGFQPLVNTLVQVQPLNGKLPPTTENAIIPGRLSDLDSIQPLWEKLTRYEGQITPAFQAQFEQRSFKDKKAAIQKVAADGQMNLDLVKLAGSPHLQGYCVSTISSEKVGKIESLYLEPELRNLGIGQRLMLRTLDWMALYAIEKITLLAAAGNTRAIHFYRRFNFYPRNTILQQT